MAAKAKNRADDLRQLKTEELQEKLAGLTEERFRMQFKRATEALTNPLQLRTIRRDIARIQTILRERQGATA
jgi:large subunit ribosomal protein L29